MYMYMYMQVFMQQLQTLCSVLYRLTTGAWCERHTVTLHLCHTAWVVSPRAALSLYLDVTIWIDLENSSNLAQGLSEG